MSTTNAMAIALTCRCGTVVSSPSSLPDHDLRYRVECRQCLGGKFTPKWASKVTALLCSQVNCRHPLPFPTVTQPSNADEVREQYGPGTEWKDLPPYFLDNTQVDQGPVSVSCSQCGQVNTIPARGRAAYPIEHLIKRLDRDLTTPRMDPRMELNRGPVLKHDPKSRLLYVLNDLYKAAGRSPRQSLCSDGNINADGDGDWMSDQQQVLLSIECVDRYLEQQYVLRVQRARDRLRESDGAEAEEKVDQKEFDFVMMLDYTFDPWNAPLAIRDGAYIAHAACYKINLRVIGLADDADEAQKWTPLYERFAEEFEGDDQAGSADEEEQESPTKEK